MRPLPSAFVSILLAVPAFAQDKVTLKLKFVPGHVVHTLQAQDINDVNQWLTATATSPTVQPQPEAPPSGTSPQAPEPAQPPPTPPT